MSSCSPATSDHHVHGREHSVARPLSSRDHVAGVASRLEKKMQDLELEWDTYKNSRSTAPGHRRSRSTGTPSSAVVTGTSPETPGILVPVFRGSPRKLVFSLQQSGSCVSSSSNPGAGAGVKDGDGKSRARLRYEEDASSRACPVDVDAGSIAATSAMASSRPCSCFCECTVPCRVCGFRCSPSSSWSGSAAAASSWLLLGEEAAVHNEMRKREGGRSALVSVGRFAAAFIGVLLLGVMAAAATLKSGMDDGYVEFLVPT